MPQETLMLDDRNFDTEVMRGNTTILVQFWAPWCEPCHQVSSYVEELAAEFEGRVVMARLNTDHGDIIAGRYKVTNIPALIMFKNGKDVYKKVGFPDKKAVSDFIYGGLDL
ncbi:thioredoxin family protein [Chitinophaga qingshengii]|uniref:Thioredoxin n=1 Tax=Chitinophaga qingshengii TaxID=1569794 RepID=A0ABR7TN08_9BACT|nr:thioredoxin domain-containing protein [Chitinophaga qingshengii]MBC9930897.1 thiol reductase thioredoxin [Chitinophaga qingshengii]